MGFPWMPSEWRNLPRSASDGRRLARIAARLATSGRLAHQTWRRFGGGFIAAPPSRKASIPISAIGNHSSISRRGRLLTCSMVRFIRSEFGQVELGEGQILLDAVTEPGVTFELFSAARTIRLSNHCLMSVASVLM